jgi:hypothetical protein
MISGNPIGEYLHTITRRAYAGMTAGYDQVQPFHYMYVTALETTLAHPLFEYLEPLNSQDTIK